MKKIYIETTIPSFYYEERKGNEMLSRKHWTQDCWDNYSSRYENYTSEAVLEELKQGNHPNKEKKLQLLEGIKLLSIELDIANIVEVYINEKIMPKDATGDALHLAIASFYKCDFLLTWNCKHIANANKFEHIRIVNTKLGLFTPTLITPLELLT